MRTGYTIGSAGGTVNVTTWRPGRSGDPNGRPKFTEEERAVRDLARKVGLRAVRRLRDLAASKNELAALKAVTAILDRAYGRPPQAELAPPEPLSPRQVDLANFTDEQFEAMQRMMRAREERQEAQREKTSNSG